MPMANKPNVSPSRTYVAVSPNGDFKGYHFSRFVLPSDEEMEKMLNQKYNPIDAPPEHFGVWNDTNFAGWWFLNMLDPVSMLEFCVTIEDFTITADYDRYEMPAPEMPDMMNAINDNNLKMRGE